MTIEKAFLKGFYKETKYHAPWLPTVVYDLGTVGTLTDNYMFEPVSTLKDMGIPFDPVADVVRDEDPGGFELYSKTGFELHAKIAGEVSVNVPSVPKGKAGLALDFAKEGAFAVVAKKSFQPRIRDVHGLGAKILSAYKSGAWPKDYVVITRALMAPYADIYISESKESKVELELSGSIELPSVTLGDPTMKLTIAKQSGTVMRLAGLENVSPAFRLLGIGRFMWWMWVDVDPGRSDQDEPMEG